MNLKVKSDVVTETFKAAEVEAALRDALISNVQSQAELYGVDLPETLSGVSKQAVVIDSLVVVEILSVAEPLIGAELPQKLVKEGGYDSVDQAVENLMPKIEKVWQKKQKGKVAT